jgi:prepilin peptidase CpaA
VKLSSPSDLIVLASVALLVAATFTDLRSRRIPNWLTFPAMALGFSIQSFQQGWSGSLAAGAGALAAPLVLMLVRAFRPIGMGDLKLSIAVGTLLGPLTGSLAMLVSAVAGGLLAIAFVLRPGSAAAQSMSPFFLGVPVLGRAMSAPPTAEPSTAWSAITIPYGVAIAVGTLLTLGVIRWS